MAACSRCDAEKALGEFYTRPDRKRPSSVCRACMRAANRAVMKRFYDENPDKYRSRQLQRRADPVTAANDRRRSLTRYAENPEVRVAAKMYRDRYRDSRRIATPPWVDLDAIRAIYRQATAAGLEVDHIVPLKGRGVCGLHVPWNLQPLAKINNRRKSNRLLLAA